MIGDTLRDVEAAARIGMRGILVRTGYGAEAAASLEDEAKSRRTTPGAEGIPGGANSLIQPAHIAADLLAAVRWLLKGGKT